MTCSQLSFAPHDLQYCFMFVKGGSAEQMISSVTAFTLTSSVFDVAVISAGRWLIIFIILYRCEHQGLKCLVMEAIPGSRLMALPLVLCLGSFAFATVKVNNSSFSSIMYARCFSLLTQSLQK